VNYINAKIISTRKNYDLLVQNKIKYEELYNSSNYLKDFIKNVDKYNVPRYINQPDDYNKNVDYHIKKTTDDYIKTFEDLHVKKNDVIEIINNLTNLDEYIRKKEREFNNNNNDIEYLNNIYNNIFEIYNEDNGLYVQCMNLMAEQKLQQDEIKKLQIKLAELLDKHKQDIPMVPQYTKDFTNLFHKYFVNIEQQISKYLGDLTKNENKLKKLNYLSTLDDNIDLYKENLKIIDNLKKEYEKYINAYKSTEFNNDIQKYLEDSKKYIDSMKKKGETVKYLTIPDNPAIIEVFTKFLSHRPFYMKITNKFYYTEDVLKYANSTINSTAKTKNNQIKKVLIYGVWFLVIAGSIFFYISETQQTASDVLKFILGDFATASGVSGALLSSTFAGTQMLKKYLSDNSKIVHLPHLKKKNKINKLIKSYKKKIIL